MNQLKGYWVKTSIGLYPKRFCRGRKVPQFSYMVGGFQVFLTMQVFTMVQRVSRDTTRYLEYTASLKNLPHTTLQGTTKLRIDSYYFTYKNKPTH
jgi:hypothetical protein